MTDDQKGRPAPPPENQAAIRDNAGTIFCIVSIFFINMLSRLALAPLLPAVELDLSLDHTQAGSLFLLVSLGYGAGLFGSTFISARICHHRQIVLSSLAVGVILLFFSLSKSLWSLRLALICLGFSGGLYLPSGVSALTSLVSKQDWGKVLSIHQLAPNLAYICAPLAADILMRWVSWRSVLAVYGFCSITVGLVFLWHGQAGDFCGLPPNAKNIFKMLTDKSVWILITLFSLALGVNQGVFAMMPLYLTVERGLDPSWANQLLTLSRIAAFGAPLITGWIADRHGLPKTLFAVVLASSLAVFSVGLAPNRFIVAGLFLQAVTSVCFFPLGFAALSRITSADNRNMAVALTIPFGHLLGAGLVPTIIGLAGDLGSFTYGFYGLGGLTLIGVYLLRFLKTD